MEKIIIGKIYMKSGNIIPFASKKFDFKHSWERLVETDVSFVKHGDIAKVNFIAWSEVEAMVVEHEIPVGDEE